MHLRRHLTPWMVSAGLIAALSAWNISTPTALAKHGRRLGPPVMTGGPCSDRSVTFTLKSQFDDDAFPQTVGAEFEVDSGVIGQTWNVTLTNNDANFFDQPIATVGPEGAFNVTHPTSGAFDIDHTVVARAELVGSNTVCTGHVVLPALE